MMRSNISISQCPAISMRACNGVVAASALSSTSPTLSTSQPAPFSTAPFASASTSSAPYLGSSSTRFFSWRSLPGTHAARRPLAGGIRSVSGRTLVIEEGRDRELVRERGNLERQLNLGVAADSLDLPDFQVLAEASNASTSASSAATSGSAFTTTEPAPLHTDPFSTPPKEGEEFGDPTLLAWGTLFILAMSYADWACNCFVLPSMLPDVSLDLGLNDVQGALLTTGYTYFFALCMIPLGMVADKVSRPKLLAVGMSAWSLITALTAGVRSFPEMMGLRLGFAAAQSVQNPVALALVPEIFPKNKSASLAVYNSALYMGRALSFSAALGADNMGHKMQAAGEPGGGAWRDVLNFVALPGFLIAAALWVFVPEPKDGKAKQEEQEVSTTTNASADVASTSVAVVASTSASASAAAWTSLSAPVVASTSSSLPAVASTSTSAVTDSSATAAFSPDLQSVEEGGAKPASSEFNVMSLLRSPTFMLTTLAASCTDVGYYSLGAFQATFYERVYGLDPSMYAPTLQWVLPLGGIVGGIGGGYLADKLSQSGKRALTTAGSTALAVPFMITMLQADTPTQSFIGLFCALSLAESWRAPAANMARSAAPPENGSSAMSLYLCVRNLVGGAGPVVVALLAQKLGGNLQDAMLVVPFAYLASATLFGFAELQFSKERKEQEEEKAEAQLLLGSSSSTAA